VTESLREGPPADTWRETFGQTIDTERRRATQRVDDHRQRLRDLDARITAQLDDAVLALTREQEQAQQSTADAQIKVAALDERQKLLDQRQKQLDARQSELDKLQADLAGSKGNEPERLKELKRREAELATARQALEAEQAKEKAERDALHELENNLKLKEQALAAREQQTKRQRQIVARQLRARKSELAAEAAQEEIGRHAAELERVHHESQQQIEKIRADFTASRNNELKSLNEQVGDLKKKLADAEAAAERAKQECDHERTASRNSDSTIQSTIVELTKLRDENKQLNTRLAEAEKRAKEAPSAGSGGGQEMEDLKRRFEMAVQDLRELKTKNVELTEQLSKAQHAPKAAATAAGGGNDWESMKKRLMAEMDSDFDESKQGQKADKLTVENAIKITDDVVAEKDREITELRQMLDSQAKQVGDVAVGAAAVAQMLDTDELVKQEREALKRLQDQLREQLRQAELETSVERARLARERAEIEEKLRSFEAEKANMPAASGGASGDVTKTSARRKWLTRLGISDGDK
jgi:chromosome segregation ATPase